MERPQIGEERRPVGPLAVGDEGGYERWLERVQAMKGVAEASDAGSKAVEAFPFLCWNRGAIEVLRGSQ